MLPVSDFTGEFGGYLAVAFAMGCLATHTYYKASIKEIKADRDAANEAKKAAESELKQTYIDQIARLREFIGHQGA